MRPTDILRAVVAVLASTCPAVLPAQSDRRPTPADLQSRFVTLEHRDDRVEAAGRDYKATFTATGVEFTPALGAGVPHNLPLQWRLHDIRRGGSMLHEAGVGAPVTREGEVIYRRGTTEERYAVRPDGVKQSFVFPRAIAGHGDLVVRCALATELQAAAGDADDRSGPIDFMGPSGAGVRVDRVLAFDAAGKQCDGALRLDGTMLELILPSAFVDTAVYPLTLDPLIGTTFNLSTTAVVSPFECDVTFADGTGSAARYLVVFSAVFSSADADLHAVRVTGSGTVTNLVIDGNSAVRSLRPRAGYVVATGNYLVAWQENSAARPLFDVRCVSLSGVSGPPSAIVNLAATAANEFHVAVAGDTTLTGDNALVAWETDSGIDMRQVTVNAGSGPAPQPVVRLATGVNVNTPALSKAADGNNRLIAVWQAPGPLAEDIFAQLMTRDLARVGPVLSLGGGSVTADREPAVDGSMIVWSRESAPLPTRTYDLYGAFVGQGTGGLFVSSGPRALATSSTRDEGAADVARLGNRHCVVYSAIDRSGNAYAYALSLNDDCTICNARMAINSVAGAERTSGNPRIGSESPRRADRALIACSTRPATGQPSLQGQFVQDLGAGTPPVTLSGACGDLIDLRPDSGPFVIGNTDFEFRALPSVAMTVFLSIGLSGTALPCGSCILTNPILTLPATQLGFAYVPFPVPCTANYIGVTLEVQWLGFGITQPTACPAVPALSASARRTYLLAQ